jgi:anti-sigma factor RsiW
MINSVIELEWARTQIEAMADGALESDDLARMQRALGNDEELRKAFAEALSLRRQLRRMPLPAPPASLLVRLLLSAPGRACAPAPRRWLVAGFGAPLLGVLSTAAIALSFAFLSGRIPDPDRESALRDFAVAMNYLRRTAVLAQDEVGRQVGHGLFVAMEISTNSLADDDAADGSNGG